MSSCGAGRTPHLVYAIRLALASGLVLASAAMAADITVIALADLDGGNGFRLDGAAAEDYSGFEVASVGDINGDGLDDLVVGAPRTDVNGYYSGSSFVVFGRDTGFPAALDLAGLDGDSGFRIDGSEYAEAGRSLAGAGDINDDGFDDLVIGAPFDWHCGTLYCGSSYIVFGRESFPAAVSLDALNGDDGFRIDGAATDDTSGYAVSGAGDIDGDGFADILIGAPFASLAADAAGAAYVVFGNDAPFDPVLSLADLDGTNGFRLDGVDAHDNAGRSVAGTGDVNGDGFADIVVGAGFADANTGASFVVFGGAGPFPASVPLAALDGSDGFRIDGAASGDNAGFPVGAAGDVNADGYADVLIAAPGADTNGAESGSVFVLFGRVGTFPATLELATLGGADGFRIDGASPGDNAGNRSATAGDVNGDGVDDLLIGSAGADPNGINSGSSHVLFGRADGFAAPIDLGALDADSGFRLDGGEALDRSGAAVSAAGDIDGDGYDDILIGAFGVDANGRDAGAAYVVFGSDPGRVFCDGFDAATCAAP